MSNLLDKASIILTPTAYNNGEALCVKPSDGSGDFDFSRNSAATRVNAQGLVENVQILSSNLVQNGDFSDGENNWSFGGDWELVNGTAEIQSANSSFLSQVNVVDLSVKNYRLQYEVVTTNGSNFRITGGSSAFGTVILDSATIGVKTIDLTSNGTQHRLIFTQSAFRGSIDNISLIEITDDTNLPRINYEGGCGSWLFEPQSTNVLTYSEDFSNAAWINNGATITSNEITSPSGTLTADLLTGVSGGYGLVKFSTWTATNKVASCFAKKGSTNLFKIANGSGGIGGVTFNLENGTVTNENSGFDGEIENYGNGWYRCTAIDTLGRSGSFTLGVTAASESVYIWGAMLEQNSFSTSYIPTEGSTVTRNQDVCTNGGSLASINSTEGVLYAEIARSEEENLYRLLGIDDGTSNNFVKMGFETSRGAFWIRAVINGVTSIFSDNALTSNPNEFYKIAIRYQSGNSAIYINGTSVLTTTTTFSSGNFTALDFNHFNNSFPFFGKTKCVAVWKEALSDAELTELTTI